MYIREKKWIEQQSHCTEGQKKKHCHWRLDKGHVIYILEFLDYNRKPKMFKVQKGKAEAQMGYSTWAKHRKIIFLIALEIFQR